MELFKHYKDGTTYIDSDDSYHGYLPSRGDKLLSIHIKHDGFDVYVYPDALAIHHKYISMVYERSFKIGKWVYPLAALTQYKANERRMLVHMDSLLRELVNQHSLDGVRVQDYHTITVLNMHKTIH